MIATSAQRRVEDYHDIERAPEDPLEYMSVSGQKPGFWMGNPELDGSVGREDFIHRTFGFAHRPLTRFEIDNGFHPAVKAWADVKLDRWKVDRLDLRKQLAKRDFEKWMSSRQGKVGDKAIKKRRESFERQIESLDKQAAALKTRYGQGGRYWRQEMEKAEAAARAEAVKVVSPLLQNSDPVGYITASLKALRGDLSSELDKARATGDQKRVVSLTSRLDVLEKTGSDYFEQSQEVSRLRAWADEERSRSTSLQKDAKALGAEGYLKESEEIGVVAEAAQEQARKIDQVLKTTPGAFSQGLTLTFSFHKSVALSVHDLPEAEAQKLRQVLEETTRELLDNTMRKYGRARTSKTETLTVIDEDGSERKVKNEIFEDHKVKSYSAAVFHHNDARRNVGDDGDPDPLEHFHCELMRDVETQDGRTLALDSTLIMQNMKAIGAEGQAIFARRAMAAGFDVEFYASEKGERTVGIAGFKDGLIEKYSSRGQAIKQARANVDDQTAWSQTRGMKSEKTPEELERGWRERLGAEPVEDKRAGATAPDFRRQPETYRTPSGERRFVFESDELLIKRLREKEATFTLSEIRRAVYFAAAEAAVAGDPSYLDDAERRVERVARHPDLSEVAGERLAALGGRDRFDEPIFYSKKHLEEEYRTLEIFKRLAGERNDTAGVDADAVIRRLEAEKSQPGKPPFKFRENDQVPCIKHASDGRRFFIISAKAGVGKTTSLEATIAILEEQKREVILCAAWNKAASQISADTKKERGKDVFTISKLKQEYEAGRLSLGPASTIIVDEAGLANHEELKFLAEVADKHGCSIGLQGDESQTAAVATGKLFRRAVESGLFDVKTMDVFTRQRDPEHKRATGLAARGDFAEVIDIYRKAGTVHDDFVSQDAMLGRIAEDFVRCDDKLRDKICIATKNEDVNFLNDSIRGRLRESGVLGAEREFRSSYGGRKLLLAEGERICLSARLSTKDQSISHVLERFAARLAKSVGVKLRLDSRQKTKTVGEKSEFGTIEKISSKGVWLRMDGQEKAVFIPKDEMPDLKYGYAATTSKLQGSTVETAFFAHSSFSNAALAYVSLSRHKKACHIYATQDQARTMVSDMSRRELKIDALDVASDADKKIVEAALGFSIEEATRSYDELRDGARTIAEAPPTTGSAISSPTDAVRAGVERLASALADDGAKLSLAERFAALREARRGNGKLRPEIAARLLKTEDDDERKRANRERARKSFGDSPAERAKAALLASATGLFQDGGDLLRNGAGGFGLQRLAATGAGGGNPLHALPFRNMGIGGRLHRGARRARRLVKNVRGMDGGRNALPMRGKEGNIVLDKSNAGGSLSKQHAAMSDSQRSGGRADERGGAAGDLAARRLKVARVIQNKVGAVLGESWLAPDARTYLERLAKRAEKDVVAAFEEGFVAESRVKQAGAAVRGVREIGGRRLVEGSVLQADGDVCFVLLKQGGVYAGLSMLRRSDLTQSGFDPRPGRYFAAEFAENSVVPGLKERLDSPVFSKADVRDKVGRVLAAGLEKANPFGRTALHLAAGGGDAELYDALKAVGADERKKDVDGRTPRELIDERLPNRATTKAPASEAASAPRSSFMAARQLGGGESLAERRARTEAWKNAVNRETADAVSLDGLSVVEKARELRRRQWDPMKLVAKGEDPTALLADARPDISIDKTEFLIQAGADPFKKGADGMTFRERAERSTAPTAKQNAMLVKSMEDVAAGGPPPPGGPAAVGQGRIVKKS